jgi:hypothetical protein
MTENPKPPPAQEASSGKETFLDKSKGLAKQFAATAKSAAMLTVKQTERTKLLNVSLPQAFAALGKQVYSANDLRTDFTQEFGELDSLHAKVEELESRAKSRPVGEKITDKAKAVAASTKDRAEAQAQRLQISRLMAKLGNAAYEKHGKGAGPAESITPIEQLLSRSDVLAAEIEELSNECKGQWVTPKRVAFGCVMVVALMGMWGLVNTVGLLSGGSNRSQESVARSVPEVESNAGEASAEFRQSPRTAAQNSKVLVLHSPYTHVQMPALPQDRIRKVSFDELNKIYEPNQSDSLFRDIARIEDIEFTHGEHGELIQLCECTQSNGNRIEAYFYIDKNTKQPTLHGPDIGYYPSGKKAIEILWVNGFATAHAEMHEDGRFKFKDIFHGVNDHRRYTYVFYFVPDTPYAGMTTTKIVWGRMDDGYAGSRKVREGYSFTLRPNGTSRTERIYHDGEEIAVRTYDEFGDINHERGDFAMADLFIESKTIQDETNAHFYKLD